MSGSFSVDNNYDRYEYYIQQRSEEIEQEKAAEEEQSVFNETEEEYYGTTEASDDLETLQNTYNLYLQAQDEDFTYDTNDTEETEDTKDEAVKTFKEGVTTDSNGEAKVSVVKWTGDSSENSTLFGIVRNHYDLDAVRKANPELKDYSDEDMRFYISEKIAEKNGIADINIIETGQELTLPSLTSTDTDETDDTDNTTTDDNTNVNGEELLAKLQSAGGDAWNEFDRLASTLGLSKDKTAEYLENLCNTVGENCIDPVIFTALLRQESGYRRDAVGDGGLAIGLGQLQPIAVEQLNQWYPDKNYSNDDRYDAYKNLEMTMMCIKGHYNEYVNAYGTEPSVRTLLGAYNQGWITLAENSGGVQYARDVLSRLNYYNV